MFTLSSEDGTNEDNTFDFEQQQQQQQQPKKQWLQQRQQTKEKSNKKKTSPQQDGQRDSELFLHLLVSLHVGNKSDKVFLPRLSYKATAF